MGVNTKTRLMLVHGLIGLSFAAIVLIGGVFVATGGEAGGVPTVPIILLAFAMAAERKLRTKAPTDAR
jgi:4-hydroxybenzoate polyprenyltransferase